MTRKLFVNLPVKNLQRTVAFFTELGFSFDPRFTDETTTCMLVGEDAYVMLLEEPRFLEFTKNRICDTSTHTEALLSLSCQSREEVDELVNKAIAAGGRHAMPPQELGFMYGWSFYDLDGHHWEVFWFDMAAMPPAPN